VISTVLAFESSALAASVAVTREGVLLAQSYQNNGLTHSRTLLSMAEDLLKNASLTLRDIDLIAVAHGPGSFTGLRIGVSAANGLAWGAGLPCVGLSSMETAALGAAHMGGTICAVQDARRSQVYGALFRAENGAIARITADDALPIETLWLALKKKNPVLVGDGAEMCYNKRDGEPARLAPPALRFPSAWAVAQLAMEKYGNLEITETARYAVPVYLRPSQAERERAERQS
jgi:tRNA threonylcarbamoyladenosine biosynthesis protein TsaB